MPLTLLVADDPGTSVVFGRVTGNPDDRTRAQIEAALHIVSMYTVH
ncbi:hypothetical protein ACIBQ5_10530 [Streptomyces massasporeus]